MDGSRLGGEDLDGVDHGGPPPSGELAVAAFRHAPIGMALVSCDLEPARLLLVNRALCTLMGRSGDDLVGAELASILHPGDAVADREATAHLLAGDTDGFQLEQRLTHADGQTLWVMLHVALVRDDAGRALYCIRQVQDIEERRRFEGELGYLVDHDPLTGLVNRRGFVRELNRQIAHVRRYGAGAAVLFIDLDDFKAVNDSLGHAVGDALIISVAEAFASRLRETDLVARLGGDEFAVLLPHATATEATQLSHSLLEAVQDAASDTLPDHHGKVTASIGVTAFQHLAAEIGGDEILVDADLAMYAAKAAGKNRIQTASPGDLPRMRTHVTWSERVRRAVADGGFELHSQPIFDLATDAVARWELLLRLPGDGAELIPPSQFLYTAERSGLILEIDRWVLDQAIDLLGRDQSAGDDLALSINVSGRSVGDLEFARYIEAALSDRQVDPSRLVLEVAETAAISNLDRARAFATRLSEMGCGFALDDFGAGFGSLYYLKYLPFDYVKIDGEFVSNLPGSGTDQVILDAIVQMCRGMGKRTIGEFVGDQQTVEVLQRHGVDFAQGYHLGRPRPIRDGFDAGVTAIA